MLCLLAVAAVSTARAERPLDPVRVTGDPVAPLPKDPAGTLLKGTGLCGAFRLPDNSTANQGNVVRTLFPQRQADFPAGADAFAQNLNDFMDGKGRRGRRPGRPDDQV